MDVTLGHMRIAVAKSKPKELKLFLSFTEKLESYKIKDATLREKRILYYFCLLLLLFFALVYFLFVC